MFSSLIFTICVNERRIYTPDTSCTILELYSTQPGNINKSCLTVKLHGLSQAYTLKQSGCKELILPCKLCRTCVVKWGIKINCNTNP